MLTKYRTLFDPLLRVVARGLVAARIGPMALTWTGLALQCAGAYLVATGGLLPGTIVWGSGALLDAFDGTVARLTGRVTRAGGYIDSLVDRYGDAAILLGIGWHYDTAWVWAACLLAIVGSTATSYAKARVYQDVQVPAGAWPDLLERPERSLIVGFAAGLQGISDAGGFPDALAGTFLPVVVAALGVLTNLTVVQRARRALRFIREAEAR